MARRSVRLLASIVAVATMATALAACGNKQATTDENGKPIVNILVRRNVTDHPMSEWALRQIRRTGVAKHHRGTLWRDTIAEHRSA